MSPFEHGEVFVLDDGGEVHNLLWFTDLPCFHVKDKPRKKTQKRKKERKLIEGK